MRERGSERLARLMASTENGINLAVAVVLTGLSVAVLISAVDAFVHDVQAAQIPSAVVELLDEMLLVLMLVEIFHTVGISIRQHHLVPQPFLVVGLIAAIRKMLVITAELGLPTAERAVTFRLAMQELGLLALVVLAFVTALIALSRSGISSDVPERAEDSGDRHRHEDPAMP